MARGEDEDVPGANALCHFAQRSFIGDADCVNRSGAGEQLLRFDQSGLIAADENEFAGAGTGKRDSCRTTDSRTLRRR